MKILILSDLNSVHTIKWITALNNQGISIVLFGFGSLHVENYDSMNNVKVLEKTPIY